MSPRAKRASRATRTRPPVVALNDNAITVSGLHWSATPSMMKRFTAAGAVSIGQATPASPAVIRFGSSEQARAAFEGAFNVESSWEEFVESVPDETTWDDPVGFGTVEF